MKLNFKQLGSLILIYLTVTTCFIFFWPRPYTATGAYRITAQQVVIVSQNKEHKKTVRVYQRKYTREQAPQTKWTKISKAEFDQDMQKGQVKSVTDLTK